MFLFLVQLFFTVIIRQLCIYLPILFFMRGLNISKQTVILSGTKLIKALSDYCLFVLLIRLQIFLLRLCLPLLCSLYCPRWPSKTSIVHLEGECQNSLTTASSAQSICQLGLVMPPGLVRQLVQISLAVRKFVNQLVSLLTFYLRLLALQIKGKL